MKVNKISLAVGLAAAGLSGQAMALAPTVTPDLIVNISGASAQQKTLGSLLSSFCVAGTLDTYKDKPASGSTGKKWRSYFCTMDTNANNSAIPVALEGKNVLFNNRSAGGSIWGVVPVARQWAVEYMNIFNGTCVSTGAGAYDCPWTDADRTTGLVAFGAGTNGQECDFQPFSGTGGTYIGTENAQAGTTPGTTVCLKSDGGVSDVEPAMFSAQSNFPGFTGGPLTSAEEGALTVNSEYGVVFGISITDNAYKHLQVLQGTAVYTNVATDPVVTGDAARPSLPSTAVASILSGKLGSFQDLDQGIAAPGPSGFMAVCRRVVGSGTQAAQNAQFMGDPCLADSALSMVTEPGAPGLVGSQYVVNNSGSGDVIDCQNDAIAGALTGFPASIDAIGFNAIEKGESGHQWKYVKIDGVDPTVANAIAGKYKHWYEQTIQWPTAATAGDILAALEMVKDASGDPTVMTAAGLSGVAALPQNGWDWETETPVMRGSRGGNSCKNITLEKDS